MTEQPEMSFTPPLLVQLGSRLWVRPAAIISIAPWGGTNDDPEHKFNVNVEMGGGETGYVASHRSDWTLTEVIAALERALNPLSWAVEHTVATLKDVLGVEDTRTEPTRRVIKDNPQG